MLEFTTPSVPRKFSFAFVAWLPHLILLPIDRQIVGATVEASATMEIAMTILEKLTFSDKTQAAVMTSPEARIRRKMLDAIDIQIAAAEAQANGATYIRRAPRWITDPESGERVRKDVPVRFRRWWWSDDTGNVMLDVRYGNRRIELKPGKPTIEVGSADNLLRTIQAVREAVAAGELDTLLMAVKKERGRPKQKAAA